MQQQNSKEEADTAEQFSSKMMNPHQRRQFEDYNIMVAKKEKIERGKDHLKISIKRSENINIFLLNYVIVSKYLTEDKMLHHIYIRNLWLSANLKAIDAYDSFYKNTKALLVLFQIMGVVPITRDKQGRSRDRTHFSWTSKESLWAYFLYSIQTIIVISGKEFI